MPFSITIAGDVFRQKLDQWFSHLKNVIIIAGDIMVVGKNQKEHSLALTTLLNTARESNVRLNYDKLQYKKTEIDFFGEMYTIDGHKTHTNWDINDKYNAGTKLQERSPIIYRYDQLPI